MVRKRLSEPDSDPFALTKSFRNLMILAIVAGNPCTPSMVCTELKKLGISYDLASCSRNMQLLAEQNLLHQRIFGKFYAYALTREGYESLLSRTNLLHDFLQNLSKIINHIDIQELK